MRFDRYAVSSLVSIATKVVRRNLLDNYSIKPADWQADLLYFHKIFVKKDPHVPQNEKVLTRFSQVGTPLCRIRLSVHKQTLPIGTDLQALPLKYCGLR